MFENNQEGVLSGLLLEVEGKHFKPCKCVSYSKMNKVKAFKLKILTTHVKFITSMQRLTI